MVVQIQMRRDSAADWTAADPTLAAGEIGFEEDTGKMKIGTGAAAWSVLAYGPTGAVVDVDNTPGGTNGEVAKAATSNIVYDHGVATTGVHGVGAGTIAKTADITATKLDDFTAPDDNTDLDASVTKHGLLMKLDGVASTKYLRGDGTWQAGTGSGVTEIANFVVSNTATANEKAQADIQSDATADQTDFTTADAAAGKGIITASSSSFTISAAMAMNDGSNLTGQGSGDLGYGTRLNITGTDYGITFSPSGNYMGGIRHLTIHTPASFATAALTIDSGTTDIRKRLLIDDVNVKAYHAATGEGTPDITAGGVGIKITCNGGMVFNTFRGLKVSGYEQGIWLYINRTAGWVYLNANHFTDIVSEGGKYLLVLEAITNSTYSTGTIEANFFNQLQFQPFSDVSKPTQTAIWCKGTVGSGTTYNVQCNMFKEMAIWDWADYGGSNNIINNNRTGYNVYEGFFSTTNDLDEGTGNVFTGYAAI